MLIRQSIWDIRTPSCCTENIWLYSGIFLPCLPEKERQYLISSLNDGTESWTYNFMYFISISHY